jgi:hypothetical protein
MLDIFHTLAEVSVAITGFSSLIVIFRGNLLQWSQQDYIAFAFVLSWSIGGIFLSLLPILLVEFEMDIAEASQIGLFSFVGFFVIVGGVLTRLQNRIENETGESAKSKVRFATGIYFFILVVISVSAGFQLLPGPVHAWYALIIVLLMAAAIQNLLDFMMRPVSSINDT